MELTAQTPGLVGARARGRGRRWGRAAEAGSRRVRIASRAETESAPAGVLTRRALEDLCDRHGDSVYALACTLLGDETAAAQALTLGMADLARSGGTVSTTDARRSWARHVYWRSQELAGEMSSTPHLPPAMVWLSQVTPLQRACLALCLFGGHTRREAADLLGVPPATVADMLTTGLKEVARLAAGRTVASA
jgi:DNA-directed RNA polymerase specialized sigma24 family protein